MELFQVWGIHDEVVNAAFPQQYMQWQMLASLGAPSREDRQFYSPALVASCAQDLVEQAIKGALDDFGGMCDLLWRHEFVGLVDQGDHVLVSLETDEGQKTISTRWLMAADGSNSAVRKALGLQMMGDGNMGSVANIYFSGQITDPDSPPSIGIMSVDPEIKGAFLCMDGKTRWCFHCYFDPTTESVEDFTDDRCCELVRRAIGAETIDIKVHSVKPWKMTALVASTMKVGNVFVLGDAAHAAPPTGGFGMNSAIQDAHNLAWKLHAVLSGNAPELLLETFNSERHPVACLNTAQSFRNARTQNIKNEEFDDYEKRIGIETLKWIEDHATLSVRSTAAEATTRLERSNLEFLEHYAAIGQDLGYSYDRSQIIVPDGRPRPDVVVSKYIPNASPGSRAPYIPFLIGGEVSMSSIQAYDNTFTLLTAPDGIAWREAAAKLPKELFVNAVTVGEGEIFEPQPHRMNFLELYGIQSDGAVLVRPDGFISFRSETSVSDPFAVLSEAMKISYGWMILEKDPEKNF
jgi:2,4-dichlorophenol 6-monooxygenase